jgi:uncharacterized protein YqeY
MSSDILVQIQDDIKAAMRAGEKQRTAALRMIASAVQSAAKDGKDDPITVLQRERKKRLEAADAFAKAERDEQAEAERMEAGLIDAYLPEQISDEELVAVVDEAIAASGAASMREMGRVMGIAMPKVKGRADGNRVGAVVREKLGS